MTIKSKGHTLPLEEITEVHSSDFRKDSISSEVKRVPSQEAALTQGGAIPSATWQRARSPVIRPLNSPRAENTSDREG